jgi:hypothetical protein
MAHDASQPGLARGALIDGRAAFTDALRGALRHAAATRQREICLVDPDFETWPLDDAEVLAALAGWARGPLRSLVLVAASFDEMPRRFARFAAWRGNWAHVVQAHVTEVEPSQVPTLLLAGEASLALADRLRWRGHRLADDKSVADWREVVDVLLQRSEPGFGANTLGL